MILQRQARTPQGCYAAFEGFCTQRRRDCGVNRGIFRVSEKHSICISSDLECIGQYVYLPLEILGHPEGIPRVSL